jgi:hypothetical protein
MGTVIMWVIFAGIALWAAFYPLIRDWLQDRADKKRLAVMRKHALMGHHWAPKGPMA